MGVLTTLALVTTATAVATLAPDAETEASSSSTTTTATTNAKKPYDGATKSNVTAVSVHAKRGPRASMEDRWFVSDDLRFFGVYDGHGGFRVADVAQRLLYDFVSRFLREESDVSPASVESALRAAFAELSHVVLEDPDVSLEGSTAVAVFLCDDEIVTANVGDSRAILCRGTTAINLSNDHKPDAPAERERIEKLGGHVKWHGYLGPDRLPVPGMGAYRINGNLAVSRALGDRLERPFVSSEPEIIRLKRKPDEDRFIIIASDGLWDALTSAEAVDFVRQIMSGSVGARRANSRASGASAASVMVSAASSAASAAARARASDLRASGGSSIRAEMDTRREKMAHYLVEEALRRGSADNVTAIVVWLK